MKEKILSFIGGNLKIETVDFGKAIIWFSNKTGVDICAYKWDTNMLFTSGIMDLNLLHNGRKEKEYFTAAKEILEDILHIKAKSIQ